ncbi:MAG TPA: hypothetical protein VFJ61_00520 [Solirubrobacterales bacterium]|nr:hypothetical protein [Solirubrobacterales bacterium]
MRTTVTLDDDVAAKLKEEAHRQKKSFKEMLNSSVRRGLQSENAKTAKPYRVKPRSMGARPGLNLDRALQLSGELEDAETARRLSLRK